jgi:hypothetical protein
MSFPLEVLEIIGYYFGNITSFKLILNIEPDKYQVFREGGFGIILEDILFNYPDKQTLVNIKKYLPNKEVALVKANLTKNTNTLFLVSKIWESLYSNYAYVHAYSVRFLGGLKFIGHDILSISQHWLNYIIIEDELDGEVDFTIDNPLKHVIGNVKYMSDLNRDELFAPYQLERIYYYRKDVNNLRRILCNKKNNPTIGTDMIKKVGELYLDENNIDETIDWLLSQGYNGYEELRASDAVFQLRDTRILHRLREHLELEQDEFDVHSAFINQDIKKIEEYYLEYGRYVIDIGVESYPDIISQCLNIRDNISSKFLFTRNFRPRQSMDINDWINIHNPEVQLRDVRTFVEAYGVEHLDKITKKVSLKGKENVTWFCSLCTFPKYSFVRINYLSEYPYLLNKVIYYSELSFKIHEDKGNGFYFLDKYESASLDLAINCSTFVNSTNY